MSTEPQALGGGRYELSRLLGRGGMAEVRLAQDVRLGRAVAIKRLRPDLASDPTFQARFRREAQSAASLNHPAVVAVYDTGEEAATDGSGLMLPYIVMEHVEGKTLRDVLREGRRILPERALEITGAVLDALDYSHRAGIIHRDIKPANVMLTPTGDVKVMDFGIARAIADSSATMTQTAAVIGTAQYLSPEQARGEQVDARSDLYSTGCLLFELLTGRPPFVGDSPVAVAYQHVREEPSAPSSLDPEISPAIDAITMKALTKPVDDRYQSASEMRADIDRALEGRSVLAPAVLGAAGVETEHFLAPEPLDSQSVGATQAAVYDEEPPRRNRAGLIWALVLLLAAAVIAALIIIPRLSSEEPTPQVSVPDVNDLTVRDAKRTLEDVGLTLGQRDTANSTSYQPGHIMRQDPARNEDVDQGSAVDVVVSAGEKTQAVPPVTGLGLALATEKLEQDKFTVDAVEDTGSSAPPNRVTRTDPAAGATVAEGSSVTVYYSPGLLSVPSVVGEALPRARKDLKAFSVVESSVESDAPTNQVVSQDPGGGTRLAPGGTIQIDISLGPRPTQTVTETPTTPTQTTPTQTTPTQTTPTQTTTTTSSSTPPPPPTTPPPTTKTKPTKTKPTKPVR